MSEYVNRRCECCGGVAILPIHNRYAHNEHRTFHVRCSSCRARCQKMQALGLRRCFVLPELEKESS